MRSLAQAITGMELPAVEKISESQAEDPFQILIATLLSARTQDATTHAASTRLFKRARTPRTMAKLLGPRDREADLSGQLLPEQGRVREGLLRDAGVAVRRQGAVHDGGADVAAGRRAQDGQPGADPRVQEPRQHLRGHARAPHLEPDGMGEDEPPDETEQALYKATDRRWWPYINLYLVTWGQNVCRPVYPRCGDCVIAADCRRIGVAQRRRPRPAATAGEGRGR